MFKIKPKASIFLIILILFPQATAGRLELPVPGVTPDNIYYPLDIWAEKIILFFTFNAEKKIEKSLLYADEKLAEINKMTRENRDFRIERAINNYEDYLNSAKNKAEDLEEEKKEFQAEKIAQRILEHEKILLEIREKSKEIIEKTLQVSQTIFSKTIEMLPADRKENLVKEQEEIISQPQEEQELGNKENGIKKEEKEEELEQPTSEQEKANLLEVCKATESSDILTIANCYIELGNNFKDLSVCEESGDIVGLGSCYGAVAAEQGNINLCNQFTQVSSEGASTILLSTCYGAFARIKNNSEACTKAPTSKSQTGCYLVLAGLEKDTAVCEHITEGKEGCYIIVASAKGDFSICNEIENKETKTLCILTVFKGVPDKQELCQTGELLGLFSEKDCLEHLQRK